MTTQPERGETSPESVVWILVDHSARAHAFSSVAGHLQESGVAAEVVTITEVIGSMARDALAGGAERVLRGLRVVLAGRSDEDLIGAVSRLKPDVLALTHPKHVRAISMLESLTGIPSLQLGVLPDYDLHAAWLRSGLHAFVVPHKDLAARLIDSGAVSDQRVLIAGPAVGPGFARPLEKESIRREFGFSMSERTVLVRAESFDVVTLEKIVFQAKILATTPGQMVRVIFHHGGDKSAASALRRAAKDYGFEALMFGKVHDLERYAAACDVVVCAPADPLLPELVALGLPLVLVGKNEEHAAQTTFLCAHQVAIWVEDLPRLSAQVGRMLGQEELAIHSKAAADIGQPGGSKEVAQAILDALAHAQDWRKAEPASAPPSSASDGSQGGAPAAGGGAGGPFEAIGRPASGGEPASAGGGTGTGSAGGTGGSSAPSLAEAKEQLAQLILVERDLERRLGELGKEQERWRGRLNLARQWEEEELASEAEGILRGFLGEAGPLEEELREVREQKMRLKQAAGRPTAPQGGVGQGGGGKLSELESRFRTMEESRDLDDLKGRIRREFGED